MRVSNARAGRAVVAVSLAASVLVGCGADPVGETADPPRLTISEDSVTVEPGASATVSATRFNTADPTQFVSRNTGVATVNASGVISGVAVGSTYVVATLASRADVRDSVLVRVKAPPASNQALVTYQNAVAYFPPGVARYRAAIVFLPGLRDPSTGLPLDSRGLVRGTAEAACSIWCGGDKAEVRKRALQLAGGEVALIGTQTVLDDPGSQTGLINTITQLGAQGQHPELSDIPIFFVGHSMGGCTAYGFSRVHGARVAGFLTMKGGCHYQGAPSAAASVPGYFLIGKLDEAYRRDNITGVFEQGRAGGAPWALSTDAYHHGPILDFDLMFDWIDAVLDARLPATPGAPLRAVTVTDGWLGARSSGAIATYGCYGSNRAAAAWLPTRETALLWQRMAGGSSVVSTC